MRLSFCEVTCRYGLTAPVVQGVTFTVGPGLWLLLGPNGSGKSTLLRCAAGLLPPERGHLLWDDADAYRLAGRYRWHLGYAPQEHGGYPELSVREYLFYLASLKGVRPSRRGGRVDDLLTFLELEPVARRALATLSGGMKSRLAVAAALLNDPDLLLLDEPSVGLDPGERVRFRNLLLDLARDRILLMATNTPDDLAGMADGLIRLRNGRMESFVAEPVGGG